MAEIVAILCHFRVFCKENLYLNRQPLCFHHFARPWPFTIPACRFAQHTGAGERELPSTPQVPSYFSRALISLTVFASGRLR